MALVARVLGVTIVCAAATAALGGALFGSHSDGSGIALILGCVGGLIGAIVGAAREIVTALHERPASS